MPSIKGELLALSAVAAATVCLHVLRRRRHAAKKTSVSVPLPPAKLRVYGVMPIRNDPDLSPACARLLAFCRLAHVPYDYVDNARSAHVPAPKSKRPFATGGVLGAEVVSDAHFVVERLRQAGFGKKLDSWLSEEQRAVATAFGAMLEESVYWGVIHVRWATSQFERVTVNTFFSSVPAEVRVRVAHALRAKVLEEQWAQGTGRHTDAEVTSKIGKQILAVSTYLGSKRYFFGDKPSSVDATVYAFCACFMQGEWRHSLVELANTCPNLVEYVGRMRAELFPELQAR